MVSIKEFETIEEITQYIKNYFYSKGLLVSENYSYKNSKDKINFTVIDKEHRYYGLTGSLIWNNFKNGQNWDTRSLTQESRNKYIKQKMEEVGLTPLEDVIRFKKKLLVKIIDKDSEYYGYKGVIIPENILMGQKWDSRILLNSEFNSYVKSYCEKLEYTVIKYPNGMRDAITILTKNNNKWNTTFTVIKKGGRCPLDNKISFGERCIYEILKLNGISFEYQKTIVHDDNSKQYMDFYLEDYNMCLEYHGEQHYKEHASNFGQDFKLRKKLDEKKINHCKINKINYIEISYKINSIDKILNKLSDLIGLKLKRPEDSVVQYSKLYNVDELLKDYKTLKSVHKVGEKYNISSTTVHRILRRSGVNTSSGKKVVQLSLQNEFIKLWDGAIEVSDWIGLTYGAITNCCNGKSSSSGGYKWMYEEDYEKYIVEQQIKIA